MIKKILRITGIGICLLIGILGLAYALISYNVYRRGKKVYTVKVEKVNISTDSATYELGKHISLIKGCQDCHGAKLEGKVFFEDPLIGTFTSANLTNLKDYTTDDWTRAIRHGLRKDGTPLIIMPSDGNSGLSEKDLGALIAYCKSLPRSNITLPKFNMGPLIKVLDAFGKVSLYPAEKIDHNQRMNAAVKPEVSVEFGKYVAQTCAGCHSPNFKGAESVVPGGPDTPDISKTGAVGKWTEAQFMAVLRTGKTPTGKQLKTEDMPWEMTKEYTDIEIKALYKYLSTR